MKHLTSTSQNNFYHTEGWIYFENYFDQNEIDTLTAPILPCLKSHDLWREIPILKQTIFKSLSSTVFALENKTTLRLAFDHYFRTNSIPKEYADLFAQGLDWGKITSFQQILCCAAIVLKENEETPAPRKSTPILKKGDVLFFSAESSFPFQKILLDQKIDFLLIGFADLSLVYNYNPLDPKRDDLKKMGYHPGDKLKESTHPCLRKKG